MITFCSMAINLTALGMAGVHDRSNEMTNENVLLS